MGNLKILSISDSRIRSVISKDQNIDSLLRFSSLNIEKKLHLLEMNLQVMVPTRKC